MDKKRLTQTIKLNLIRNGMKRGQYLREKGVFLHVGIEFLYMPRVVPLYAKLISFGDHVNIASDVVFTPHDGTHTALNAASINMVEYRKHIFYESIGCIAVGNNVYIGARSIICANVRIGDNVIISAGSVITSDIPSNSVIQGNPARRLCSFDQYYDLRATKPILPQEFNHTMGTEMDSSVVDWLWKSFNKSRGIEKR